jgi:hypothetical protein
LLVVSAALTVRHLEDIDNSVTVINTLLQQP